MNAQNVDVNVVWTWCWDYPWDLKLFILFVLYDGLFYLKDAVVEVCRRTHGKTHDLLQHSTALISSLFRTNIATPFNSYDGHSLYQPNHLYPSVLIYLIPTASISAVGPSCLLHPVLTDCNSLFPTYLHHSVTSDWYSPDNPTNCISNLIPSIPNSL